MDRSRLDFQLGLYSNALAALEDAIRTDDGEKKSRDSILLSFVFTFEMAWKSVKFALDLREFKVNDYAAAALSGGFQAGLIDDPAAWDLQRKHRNNVSHAYDKDEAIEISAFVREYSVGYFRQLLSRLKRDD